MRKYNNLKQRYNWFRLCFIGLLGGLLALSGCGFQLRGYRQMPIASAYNNLYLESSTPYEGLTAALRQALQQANVKLAKRATDAMYILSLDNIDFSKHNLSVLDNERTTNHHFIYQVTFSLTDKQGHLLLPPTRLEATRIETTDSTDFSNSNTEILLRNTLEQNLITRILNRLNARATQNKQTVTKKNESGLTIKDARRGENERKSGVYK